jgi:DNA-binding NarL/FixJ family response regulator
MLSDYDDALDAVVTVFYAAAADRPARANPRRAEPPGGRARDAGAVAPPQVPPGITEREREVLALVGTGLSNPEIAARLHLGVTTVKTHVANLMAKTRSANRVQLAVYAAGSSARPSPHDGGDGVQS